MHGRRVLGVTSEQTSDRFAIDPEFPKDSGRILAEPRRMLRRGRVWSVDADLLSPHVDQALDAELRRAQPDQLKQLQLFRPLSLAQAAAEQSSCSLGGCSPRREHGLSW